MQELELSPVRIFISRAGMSNQLRLRDNRNNPNPTEIDPALQNGHGAEIDTLVNGGDLIIWELDPRSLSNPPEPGYFPIKSIDSIVQTFGNYPNSVPVLSSQPVNAGNAFIGTVPNPTAGVGKFANYQIEYTLPDGSTHVHDPKIVLNS